MLPQSLREAIEAKTPPTAQTIFVLLSPPLPNPNELKALLAPFAPTPTPTDTTSDTPPEIHLHPAKIPLYPPFNSTQAETWTKSLWPIVFNPAAPRSFVAPPPQTLSRAQDSISPRAGYHLSLAQKVAQEAFQSGRGRPVGAVIVDPAIDEYAHEWDEAVLAVAGDARYSRSEGGAPSLAQLHAGGPNPACESYNADLEGGPELHALMRAVELVARWRREHDHESGGLLNASAEDGDADGNRNQLEIGKLSSLESYFLYRHNPAPAPSSPSLKRKLEDPVVESDIVSRESDLHVPLPGPAGEGDAAVPRIRTRSQGGYLCTDLDVYLSHEPCLCCSMGMLLSRFRAVVFPRRGRLVSGGIASEPVVGPVEVQGEGETEAEGKGQGSDGREYYGLHWRKELNWRALGFEFVEDEDGVVEDEMSVFHA
jgi:tRNA-specific adenosine deaminase 3